MQEFIENYLKYFFIGAAVLAALSSFARPDFNLPLYIFIYLMWDNGFQKLRIIMLMAVTLVADACWVFYWAPIWRSEELGDFEKGIHGLVIFTSMIGFIVKIILTIFMCFKHKGDIQSNLPSSVVDKIPARFKQ